MVSARGATARARHREDTTNFQTARGDQVTSISCTFPFLLFCQLLRNFTVTSYDLKITWCSGKKTLNGRSAAPEAASMSSGKNEVKSCPIPTRVLTLKDWSQLPDCYSQTPGGTLFSTTPGGNDGNNYLFVEMSLWSRVKMYFFSHYTSPVHRKLWPNL